MFDTLKVIYEKDPALKGGINFLEVLLYPGLWAIWSYRIAHALYRLHIPFIPRLMAQVTRFLTGIEIHPGAKIGRRFFIDHGMGVVIGETAEVGNDCMLYHGVTLGGSGWWKDEKGEKRHPTLEDHVTIGMGSAILGAVTIGRGSIVGAGSIITKNIPQGVVVVEHNKVIGKAPELASPYSDEKHECDEEALKKQDLG